MYWGKSASSDLGEELQEPQMKYTTLVFLELPHQIEQINTDTGAKVSVYSLRQAKQWGLYDKMYKSNTKPKPFSSELMSVEGQVLCSVSFNKNSILVKWYIIPQDCEPILVGEKAVTLGIITFKVGLYRLRKFLPN